MNPVQGEAYNVDSVTGCWVWYRARDAKGYGHMWLSGRYAQAHRVVYELHRGPIPTGLQLDYLCRNRACVNPEHLEPVTHAENSRRGVMAKLTASQAAEIRNSSEANAILAARYGVGKPAISRIKRGRRWVTQSTESNDRRAA